MTYSERYLSHSVSQRLNFGGSQPSLTDNLVTKTETLFRRSESSSTASITNCAQNDTCLGGGLGNNTVIIVLGSSYFSLMLTLKLTFLLDVQS